MVYCTIIVTIIIMDFVKSALETAAAGHVSTRGEHIEWFLLREQIFRLCNMCWRLAVYIVTVPYVCSTILE